MATLADIQAKKKAKVYEVRLQLDGEVLVQIEHLRRDIQQERQADRRLNRSPKAPALERELETLLEASRETEQVFRFRSIGGKAYNDLILQYPPTKDQVEYVLAQTGTRPEWNIDTFPPVLIAAACAEPEMTIEEAQEIWDDPAWNSAELEQLLTGAVMANRVGVDIPLSRSGTGTTLDTLSNLITAENGESPTAGSSAAKTSGRRKTAKKPSPG